MIPYKTKGSTNPNSPIKVYKLTDLHIGHLSLEVDLENESNQINTNKHKSKKDKEHDKVDSVQMLAHQVHP